MPISLSQQYRDEQVKWHQLDGVTFLYDVQVSDTTWLFLTEWNANITFTGLQGNFIYYKFPIQHDKQNCNQEFNFQNVTLTIPSVSREIVDYIYDRDGLLNKNVWMYHYFLGTTPHYENSFISRFVIQNVQFDQSKATFVMSAIDFSNARVPGRRIIQDFCQWIYGGKECRYYLGRFAELRQHTAVYEQKVANGSIMPKCDHRIFTSLGCMAHTTGEGFGWQIKRFGGFPGVTNRR